MNELQHRIEHLVSRLKTSYDSIGHSSGRPFVYFVYPPDLELGALRLADEAMGSPVGDLSFVHVDLLPLIMQATAGQEERREALLNDPAASSGAAESVMRLWVRAIRDRIVADLAAVPADRRPVIVLRHLAALHPLGHPTGLMELLAEQEIRVTGSGRIVPIVILVPGTRPPQTSRRYDFLGLERLALDFYRGEEA